MDNGNQLSGMKQTTLSQKVDMVANWLAVLSLPVLVFMRSGVGYRTLKPFYILIVFFIMQFLPAIGDVRCTIGGCRAGEGISYPFYLFTYAFLFTALGKRYYRWWRMTHGQSWHSHSRGVSYFEFLCWFRLRPSRFIARIPERLCLRIPSSFVYRYLDGAVVIIFSMLLDRVPGMHGLAQWLYFSSFCLIFVECYVHDKQIDRELDLLDSLIEGEVHAQIAQRYRGVGSGQAVAPSLAETAGIPTGLGPDIARQVDARRAGRPSPNALPDRFNAA